MQKSRFLKGLACGLCASVLLGVSAPVTEAASKAEQAQAKTLYSSAYSSYKSGDLIAAADGFINASKLDKENPLISMSAGEMLLRLKQYQSSIRYFRMAEDNFRHAPKGTKDRVILKTYSGLSHAYLESGDKDNAISNAEEVVKRFGKKYDGYLLLGNIYAMDGGDEVKAIENYEKALEMDDSRTEIYDALLDLYKKKGDNEEQENVLKRGCVARPLDEIMKAKLGEFYLEWHDGGKNHYAEAEQVFKDLVGLNEKSAWGHYYLGAAYTLQGNFDDASNELAILSSLNQNLANRLRGDMEQQRENNPSQDAPLTISVGKG